MKLTFHVYVHRLPGDDDTALEERIMANVNEKIATMKAAFDAMAARVESMLADKAATDAALADLDDMTTRAAGLAVEPAPTPTPTPNPPNPPMPPVP